MKSNAYWINRVNEVLADNHQSSTEQILRINKAYEQAAKDIQRDIDQIFNTYANHHNLTPTQAKKLLNGKIDNFIYPILKRIYPRLSEGKLKDWCLAELNANAYRARITRLEALKKSVKLHCLEVYEQELKLSKASYIKTIKEAYYRTCYNFQMGVNLAFDVANINTRAVNMILNTEWFGRNYSDSIWNNTQALVDRLDETITSGFLSGKSLKDIAKNIAELSSFGMFAAERLVRSETTFFNNQAALQGYKEVGIEKYVYVATLDARTCSCGKNGKVGCQQLDRKVFKISEQEPSKNCPPMHAFCRCTVRSYINDEILSKCNRRARDPETGKTYLVGNMSYEDWKNQYVKGNSQAELAVKKQRNLSADKKQYKEYKSVLGKEAPKTFEAFQSLKYNEVDGWKLLKAQYRKTNSYNMIIQNEPRITNDLMNISNETNVSLVGLEYRLKTKESFLRKVNSDSMNSLDESVILKTINNTNDVIRYTYQADCITLVDSYKAVSSSLANRGYKRIKVKNTWLDKHNPYNGVNCVFEDLKGQRFEVQFHTPESFKLKNGDMHKLYERMRLDTTSQEEKNELAMKMFELSSKLERPLNIEQI